MIYWSGAPPESALVVDGDKILRLRGRWHAQYVGNHPKELVLRAQQLISK